MKKVFVLFSLLMLASCAGNQQKNPAHLAEYPPNYKKFFLREGIHTPYLLFEARYDELFVLYQKLEEALQQDLSKEEQWFEELFSVNVGPVLLKKQIAAFSKAYPDSALPALLEAARLKEKSIKLLEKGNQDEIDLIQSYQQRAVEQVNKAIAISGERWWLYDFRGMLLTGLTGDEEAREATFQKGLSLKPESYKLWLNQLDYASWEGALSAEKMQAIVDDSRPYWQKNPELSTLSSKVILRHSEEAISELNFGTGISLAQEALKIREDYWTRFLIGKLQYQLNQEEEGCKNILKAAEQKPTLRFEGIHVDLCQGRKDILNSLNTQ